MSTKKGIEKKARARGQRRLAPFHPVFAKAMVGVSLFLVMYIMLVAVLQPERYDLRVGQIVNFKITATRDVEDTVTTEERRERAMQAIKPSYNPDDTVMPSVLASLTSAFDRMRTLRDASYDAQAPEAQEMLGGISITEEGYAAIFSCTLEELNGVTAETLRQTREKLELRISEGQEAETISVIAKELEKQGHDPDLVAVMKAVLQAYLRPNLVLDVEATEKARKEASDAVEPEIYKAGRNIVYDGEPITKAQYAMLDSLDMLKDRSFNISLYLGSALLLILLMAMMLAYLYQFERKIFNEPRLLALLATIAAVNLALALLIRQIHVLLMPISLGALLVALLLERRGALIYNLANAIMVGFIVGTTDGQAAITTLGTMLLGVMAGSASVYIVGLKPNRIGAMIAGLAVSALNVVTVYTVGLINIADSSAVIGLLLWAAGSGPLGAVLCIGMLPALEWLFNLATPTKLIELSSPNQPLIRRLLLEAPGTYHHSIIVANLSEAACNAIEANGLLARVGAYYHDIGKLKRPLYFKENQLGDNPHDRTDPVVSTAILTAHPRDGVQMAQKQRIPQPILDIIAQHHGDTPVMFFYDRALKQKNEEDAIDPSDFRYDSPKPQTAEAAVVMLADTVEAAARAMVDPDIAKMDLLIGRLIRGKMEDGQLDESPLTFRDLGKIQKAFLTVLTGVFHERIEYPAVEIPARPNVLTAAYAKPVTALPESDGHLLEITTDENSAENAPPEEIHR